MSPTCGCSFPRSGWCANQQVTGVEVEVPLGHEPFGHGTMPPVSRRHPRYSAVATLTFGGRDYLVDEVLRLSGGSRPTAAPPAPSAGYPGSVTSTNHGVPA